ncbi:outer membrane beta-barrel protein [uncultured Aliiroseovarius sp.]|uniref:outer membrane protein n=1 Tax=uncultured Aliiroseovarius sp. TaxID=1658783 RepID=UPI00262527BF|nr:outer membrane beta-barrel protein [uncultured Aliiroseovarius sp.]
MKTKLCIAALLATASVTPVIAGSMTEPAVETTPTAVATDWSGSYGGLSLGYGSGMYDQGVSALNQDGPNIDVNGAMIGAHYGRNYQNGNTVYGFDIGVSTGVDGTAPVGTWGDMWGCGTGECNIDIEGLVTLRGRYGELTNDGKTLFYGTAGLAAARYVGGIYNSSQQGVTETNIGFTAGIGIEHMLQSNMSIFGEANYVDLGTLDFGTNGGSERYDGEGAFFTARVGVNYHF